MSLISNLLSVFNSVWSILLAFVVLMVMVTIHEFGHYVAGTIFDFQINEFSVGMGPKIFQHVRKKDGQIFSLRLLPLGGYCAFEGEDESNDNPRAFNNQKPYKRLIVLFAGAFFNFISAIIIAIILFSSYGDTVAKVNYVYDYAPTYNTQLQPDDVIYKINGKRVFVLDNIGRYMTDETMDVEVIRGQQHVVLHNVTKGNYVSPYVKSVTGEFATTYVDDNGVEQEYKLVQDAVIYKLNGELLSAEGDFLRALQKSNDTVVATTLVGSRQVNLSLNKSDFGTNVIVGETGYSGIGMSIQYATFKFSFGEAIARAVPYCGETAMLVLRTLGGLITGVVGVDQVGGPITTISLTSQVVSTGLGNTLMLIVLISVNLAVFNLLPVPALDGCRMVFVIIEWIAGKPIDRKVEGYINTIGLFLLLGLMVLIDLLKL